MNFSEAVEKIIEKRQAALLDARVYKNTLIGKNDSLYEAEKSLRAEQLKAAKGKKNTAENCAKALQLEYERAGADMNALFPPVSCPLCQDSGFLNGKTCACVNKLVLSNYNGDIPLKNFTDFNLSLFTQNKALAEKTNADMKNLADKFPTERVKNIVLMGSSGTGKTFLAGCVAKALILNGFSVEAVSSYNLFNNHLTKYHTTFDSSKQALYDRFIDCDLLIIDDLGTESMIRNVTLEYFCSILNDRLAKNKHTMITTNMNVDDISNRYDVKISSRLFDANISYAKILDFNDLRKQKR